jgi:hypothetical protein
MGRLARPTKELLATMEGMGLRGWFPPRRREDLLLSVPVGTSRRKGAEAAANVSASAPRAATPARREPPARPLRTSLVLYGLSVLALVTAGLAARLSRRG